MSKLMNVETLRSLITYDADTGLISCKKGRRPVLRRVPRRSSLIPPMAIRLPRTPLPSANGYYKGRRAALDNDCLLEGL
nr:MAG TPA: hypothetical protein [Caudoviricetes sp.]